MKTICNLIIASLILAGNALGALSFDGSYWQTLNEWPASCESEKMRLETVKTLKGVAIRGIFEGFQACEAVIDSAIHTNVTFDVSEAFFPEVDYEKWVTALDQFYGDYKNTNIPIPLALRFIAMELRGEDREDIDAALRRARRVTERKPEPSKPK